MQFPFWRKGRQVFEKISEQATKQGEGWRVRGDLSSAQRANRPHRGVPGCTFPVFLPPAILWSQCGSCVLVLLGPWASEERSGVGGLLVVRLSPEHAQPRRPQLPGQRGPGTEQHPCLERGAGPWDAGSIPGQPFSLSCCTLCAVSSLDRAPQHAKSVHIWKGDKNLTQASGVGTGSPGPSSPRTKSIKNSPNTVSPG